MPSMSVDELKERLTRDLPGAGAPARARAEHAPKAGAAPNAVAIVKIVQAKTRMGAPLGQGQDMWRLPASRPKPRP